MPGQRSGGGENGATIYAADAVRRRVHGGRRADSQLARLESLRLTTARSPAEDPPAAATAQAAVGAAFVAALRIFGVHWVAGRSVERLSVGAWARKVGRLRRRVPCQVSDRAERADLAGRDAAIERGQLGLCGGPHRTEQRPRFSFIGDGDSSVRVHGEERQNLGGGVA